MCKDIEDQDIESYESKLRLDEESKEFIISEETKLPFARQSNSQAEEDSYMCVKCEQQKVKLK